MPSGPRRAVQRPVNACTDGLVSPFVPPLVTVLRFLPAVVFVWMMVGAARAFSPDTGRRSLTGLGVACSMWFTLGAASVASAAPRWMQCIGAGALLLSLALYQWASISIRDRLFSFAGNDDLPQFVHRSGPFALVRNPFYLSYLLAEIATLVMWPSLYGAVVIVLAIGYFHWLAWFEEGKFARSPVAAEYAQYKAGTGRLLPRIRQPH